MENENHLDALLEMGYDKDKAVEALEAHPESLQAALEFLIQKEEDTAGNKKTEDKKEEVKVAKSYICTDTGKVFRTMRDAQFYAERTGNTNFEESDIEVPPLTEEEKKEKIAQLRAKMEERKKQREVDEKAASIVREKMRREEGQKDGETRELMEKQRRMYDYEAKKREKQEDEDRRLVLRKEIAKDKANRAFEKAKARGEDGQAAFKAAYEKYMTKTSGAAEKSSVEKFDVCISAIDVLDTKLDVLKTLKTLLANVVKDPEAEKFRKIKLGNAAFHQRVGRHRSGMAFLKNAGFEEIQEGDDRFLFLPSEKLDMKLVEAGLAKLNATLGI